MARLILEICPKVQLCVAKLNEVWRDGKLQITAKSAAQAIDWARENDVDIISMSWSIEAPEEPKLLEEAVKAALEHNILLFCSSDDQGNLTDIPYPAKVDTEKIIQIGSATALGLRADMVQEYVNFIAPGFEYVEQSISKSDQDVAEPLSGSSIATARCAGLAAVILQCIMLYQKNYTKKQVRTHENMTTMLKRLVDGNDKHKYLRVWYVFGQALETAELDENYEWSVISSVARVFLGRAPQLSELNYHPVMVNGV